MANLAARAHPACVGLKPGSPASPQRIPNEHRIGYSWDPAVVVVEGASLATVVTRAITMLFISVILKFVGLGIFCWALFALATHALPLFAGMTVGITSLRARAGPFGTVVVGFVTASFTLKVGQFAFSVARSPIVRLVIGRLFAVPAVHAGYDVTLALARLGIALEAPQESFAVLGAIAVRGAGWMNVSMQTYTALRSRAAISSIQLLDRATTTGG
jgi:hypothetical protein